MSAAVAEQQGMASIALDAVDRRLINGVPDSVYASYQVETSARVGHEVYFVETLGVDKGQLVELDWSDGYLWASCGCEWFLFHYSKNKCCKHITRAVELSRKRR